jgi:translation factor GUF1, mitochondrial
MDLKKISLKNFKPNQIRNFSIIAHIDHGKSTLSDRLLEYTGTLSERMRREQFLDKLQVEKERGITVKAQTASMFYEYEGVTYLLNLIDTPGHVDFSYEVSRSLYACQGALLLVDAAQGVQAQTMANFYLAFESDLKIIPIINKIDLPTAEPERVTQQLESLFDFKADEIIQASAKSGIGIKEILEGIIKHIPAPKVTEDKPLKALLFDSWFDEYRGVVCLIAVHDGVIKKGDKIHLAQANLFYDVLEVGLMYPEPTSTDELYAGQVGYLITGMKTIKEARIGDTVCHAKKEVTPFPGFKPAKPMVFAGIFPIDANEFQQVQEAIEKLMLNDASVTVEKTSSAALGIGFRCGFLGLLHMDVFNQRLQQEYNANVIATAPSVLYKVELKYGKGTVDVETPAEFPDPGQIETVNEPIINATIITPVTYLGSMIKLCEERRGIQLALNYMDEQRAVLKYRLPLNEVATDFYDELKSLSSGYASFDYEQAGYEPADLVKMDILLNGSAVDALSSIVHEDKAYFIGRELTQRLKKAISRQLVEIVIQAAIGSKVIARERLAPLRKDVIAKCYGGDITRKRKLLEKQKAGKKRMKSVGNVELSQEAFMSILKKTE